MPLNRLEDAGAKRLQDFYLGVLDGSPADYVFAVVPKDEVTITGVGPVRLAKHRTGFVYDPQRQLQVVFAERVDDIGLDAAGSGPQRSIKNPPAKPFWL